MAAFVCRTAFVPSVRTNFTPFHARPHPRFNWPAAKHVSFKLPTTKQSRLKCAASESDRVAEMSNFQKKTTELLSELLKAENPRAIAEKNVDFFTEEFFAMSSAFMEMARKEGNKDMVKRMGIVLKVAMDEKEKTLRPEIRLLNQLLQQLSELERMTTFQGFLHYLKSDGYFFELLRMMTKDVEMQMDSLQKSILLKQLENIKREAETISKTLEKAG
ncbi:hypothetical protein SUGI_0224210 [Cryptomeria japonica]|uniref:uncharacterized protein LOC131048576 n=1 Tax=Cryptomeria japonica TaxID=3369 RepID=UPI002408BEB4|nr:uncharacterized protein LOC131048576 [Cryptomeria japonica]GLJ14027.1 hypothetical protein SUGI_0224210 [Cryptomeria japonica]